MRAQKKYKKDYAKLMVELKRARKSAGLTQLEVALSLNKHPPFISKIEKGERRIDVIELLEFCDLYGIAVTFLLKRAGLL